MPSETVQRVTESFHAHRERFERFCRSLSEEELSRPVPDSSWTVKDFVSHLATLDTELIRWFDGVRQGMLDEPAHGATRDIDSWNETQVAQRRDRSLEEILEEAARNRAQMLAALSKLEDEHIERVVHFAGDNKRDPADVVLKLFLHGLARHDPIHVADMVKALPERKDDPDVKAWLDDSVVNWYQTTMAGPPRR